MTIRGTVDAVTTKGATGWAYAPGRRDDIVVQAVLSHEVIGDAVATGYRPDLAAVGMGKGNCGYTIEFYREIDPLYLPFVSVKVDGGDAELPRAGQLGFSEFFTALHGAHPAAGRSRSVLGGLWTDRTDAAAMLKAKTEIGQIAPEVAPIVGQLVHLGIAIVEPLEGFHDRPAGEPDGARLARFLEATPLLTALRAVLEDNPLVVAAAPCHGDTALVQPSAESRLPSAAECLVVATPAADHDIAVEIVRDSHRLPEFTPGGVSRWANGQVHAGIEIAAARQGLLTRHALSPGAAALIGPGTIYRLRCSEEAAGLKMICAPARAMPMALAGDTSRRETVGKSGLRLWL
ncbi:MAG TPA: hypothetical protein VG651_20135 [Stellaceae bacterium]|nr:hypothetical protein [Stellaceae bacterium]